MITSGVSWCRIQTTRPGPSGIGRGEFDTGQRLEQRHPWTEDRLRQGVFADLAAYRVERAGAPAGFYLAVAGRRGNGHCLSPRWYTYLTRKVYDTCMSKVRTNIEIEDDYVQMIMDRYGVHTKTEAVELALRHLAGQPMTREQALAMRGAHAIAEIPADVAPRGAG
jgi:Arc/MetJ family transcription regulator